MTEVTGSSWELFSDENVSEANRLVLEAHKLAFQSPDAPDKVETVGRLNGILNQLGSRFAWVFFSIQSFENIANTKPLEPQILDLARTTRLMASSIINNK